MVSRALPSLLVLSTTAGLLGVQPVQAQEEPDSVVEIQPVLVRVLRSEVGLGTASPVSVVSGPQLTRSTQGAFLEEALRAVPGVQIHNRYNLAVGERVAVRGFGARSQFGVRGVRVLVDGIPATLPDGQATLDHLDLSSIGRVEALRGPSSALYGNAAGGVLHFRTIDPASAPAEATARVTSSGSDGPYPLRSDLFTLQTNVTGSSGEVGYRVGFSRMLSDGYRYNPIADDGTAYGAARRSIFNGTLTVPVAGGTLRFVANGADMFAENPGSLNETVLAEGRRAAHGFNIISGSIKDLRQGQVGTAWTGEVAGGETEVALWGIRRELYNPIPGRVIQLNRNAGGVRAVTQRSTETVNGNFGVGFGFEVEMQRDDRQNFGSSGGNRTDLRLDQQENVGGIGLFTQARFDLNAGIAFLAGLRYDRVTFSVDDSYITMTDGDDSGERTMDAFSPSFGVVASVADRLELFASVSRSFETPTTTELANQPSGAGGFNPSLEPQFGHTFEGGFRAGAGSPVLVEAAVFRTDITNGLSPFEVNNRTYYQNAAEVKHFGWEVSLDSRPLPWLSGRVAVTHIDAEFENFVSGNGDHSGNKVPGLAPNRADILAVVEQGRTFLEVRGLYQDDVPVDDDGMFFSADYFIADVRVGATGVAFGSSVAAPYVGITNLFNRRYNASVVPNAFGSRYFEPGPGRRFQVGLGVTWGG